MIHIPTSNNDPQYIVWFDVCFTLKAVSHLTLALWKDYICAKNPQLALVVTRWDDNIKEMELEGICKEDNVHLYSYSQKHHNELHLRQQTTIYFLIFMLLPTWYYPTYLQHLLSQNIPLRSISWPDFPPYFHLELRQQVIWWLTWGSD